LIKNKKEKEKPSLGKRRNQLRIMILIAIFSSFSVIAYQLNFSLPFFPPFLKIHFSHMPEKMLTEKQMQFCRFRYF